MLTMINIIIDTHPLKKLKLLKMNIDNKLKLAHKI